MIALTGIMLGLCIIAMLFCQCLERKSRMPTSKEYTDYENKRIKSAALRRNNP